MHTKRSHHGYGQTANHGDKVRRPRKEGQTGFILNLPKLGLDEREPNTDRLDNLWVFPSRPAEASKKGGSRTRRGEVGTGSTLPKDMMEMTERGAPGQMQPAREGSLCCQ